MKYIVSNYGSGVCVGLLDQQTAECDINLAYNLFGSNFNEYLFHGSINFSSLKQFKRFLAFKQYYQVWDEYWNCQHDSANNFKFWKLAFARAKKVFDKQVGFDNFMHQMTSNNCYQIGCYQDEAQED